MLTSRLFACAIFATAASTFNLTFDSRKAASAFGRNWAATL
jgi:hypothetical protein